MRDGGIPAPMHGVELQQVGVHRRIADRVIDPGDLRAAFQQGLQRQLADAAKAVQGVDRHALSPAWVRPMSSTALCRAIRSSEASGNAVKAVIRLRSAP